MDTVQSTAASTNAESLKLEGNSLFMAKDYEGAARCYTDAMQLDPLEPNYPLNRCFAYLKLKRWADAEKDASTVLAQDSKNLKALYRRSLARKAQENFSGARADLFSFADAGGDLKTVFEEMTAVAAAESDAVIRSLDTPACGFRIAPCAGRGLGMFATRSFVRGDLILAEKPLYTALGTQPRDIVAAVDELPDDAYAQLMQLHDSQDAQGTKDIIGVHATNALAISKSTSILCLRLSRANHSCAPNAGFAWHAESGTARLYALCAIAPGAELFHTYVRTAGATREERAARLALLGFVCACPVCTLPEPAARESDRRRREIGRLWRTSTDIPLARAAERVEASARGVRLLREEGLHSDADGFTVDAAIMSVYHSDWASAKYWALETYKARVEQFGGDCGERTTTVTMKKLLCNPRGMDVAGKGKKKKLLTRLVSDTFAHHRDPPPENKVL